MSFPTTIFNYYVEDITEETKKVIGEEKERIATAMNQAEDIVSVIDGGGGRHDSANLYCYYTGANITFSEDQSANSTLNLDVILTCKGHFRMVTKCDLECYTRISIESSSKWLDIFRGNVDELLQEDGWENYNFVKVGLRRQLKSPIGIKQEFEEIFDDHSSGPDEIEQKLERFLDHGNLYLKVPVNFKQELKALLNDFLTCVENARA